MYLSGVCQSVCLSQHGPEQQTQLLGGLAGRKHRSIAARRTAARHVAGNAGSATLSTYIQGRSGAGTQWNAVPANILEPERRSSKYRWPQVER